jgi:hypothetical protein
VHQSHGIRSGAEFKYGGITPLSVDTAVYQAGYRPQDQRATWNAVRDTSAVMQAMYTAQAPAQPASKSRARLLDSILRPAPARAVPVAEAPSAPGVPPMPPTPTVGQVAFGPAQDNLKQNFDDFTRNFDAILSKARLHDNQVGLALITEAGCKTIELFDLPASWEAIHKDAVKRMGTELLRGTDKSNVFEYKPEHAVDAVRKVLGLDYTTNLIYEHKPSNGEPHVAIFGLTAARYVGEIVEVDGRVIHLNILETASV